MTAETGDITWSEPEDDGGAPVSAYVIERRDVTQDDDHSNADSKVATFLTQLKPATQYAVYVQTYTVSTAERGAESSIKYFTTEPDRK